MPERPAARIDRSSIRVAGRAFLHRRLRPPIGIPWLAALIAAGCAGPLRHPDVPRAAAGATGSADLIAFQVRGGSFDQPTDPGPHLSATDAVRLALANDSGLQVALAKVRGAEADARQARLLPNPVLGVILRFGEGGGDPIITVDLAADLVSLLGRPRRVGAADRRLRAAAEDALTVVLDLVAEVETAYATAQALDAHVVVLAERRALIDRLVALAQARLDAGEGTRLDVTAARTERVNLEGEIASRELERVVARLALARLIGRPSDAAGWALDPWQPAPGAGARDEAAWVETALGNRPEVRAKRWELAALGDEAALAAWEPFRAADVGGEAERDIDWTAGPSLTAPLPLFDWGQASRAKVWAARVQARHELTRARRQVVEETRAAYATVAASRAALERVRGELIPLQESRRQQAEDLYRAGESDLTALLVAEQALQEAREGAVDLQEKTTAAWSKLHRAVGGHGVAAGLDASVAPGETP
jgi:outer membrane protein, heavy metal efflux system